MEKGTKGRVMVTYATVRKARKLHTNVWSVSLCSGADVSFSSAKSRYFATRSSSQSQWFEQFTKGLRMTGVMTRQDRAHTLPIVHGVMRLFKDKWEEFDGEPTCLEWILVVMFFLASCLGGMRGFKVVWMDLAVLLHEIGRLEDEDDQIGVGWPIVGHFKNEGGGVGGHVIPIAGTTDSGLEFFKWTQRFVYCQTKAGRSEGWAFVANDGKRAKASLYQSEIFVKLIDIQERRPDLIDPILDVYEDYGIQRSGRRSFDTECRLRGVKKEDIEAQCQWILERDAQGVPAPRDMVDCYSEYRHMRETLLKPSQGL